MVFVCLLFASCVCFSAETIQLTDSTSEVPIKKKHIAVFDDPKDRLRIEDIVDNRHALFTPSPQDVLNFGHTASSIWVHFSVSDVTNNTNNRYWILESSFPLLARFDVFIFANGEKAEQFSLGYNLPMDERQLQHRFFAQPISIAPNTQYDIYINVKRAHGSVQIPLKLSRPVTFIYNELSSNHVFGIFFGIMIAMAVYNLFLLFSVGSRAYFYYITYILTSLLTFQSLTGYGYLFLWNNTPAINEYITQIAATMAGMSGLLFVRHFIALDQYYKHVNKVIDVMVGVGAILILVKLFTDYFLSLHVSAYINVLSIGVPIVVFMCWRKGSRPAGFFLLAWFTLIIGIILYTLNLLGLVPSNVITTNAVLIGAAAEMLLLSLGLADRINTERKAKYLALEEQHKAVVLLKDAEDRLMHRALHTRTTGLPNRTFLRGTLDNRLIEKPEAPFCLILVTLNNFHEFNKTLGHSNGDAILYILTERMKLLAESITDVLAIEQSETGTHYTASVEGVTFALLMENTKETVVSEVVHQLLIDMEKPFEYQSLTLNVDVSAGTAIYPQHGENSENLLRNAQIALEAASSINQKSAIYSGEIDPYNARRISLLGELRNAIENDTLQLYFQPQISLSNGRVSGAEVLIRWIHPEYGFIAPDEFIPLAERTGVIHPLTYWICRKAFEFKHSLAQQGYDISLSINISARNLQDPHFTDQVYNIAQETNTSLSKVIMEITETAVMDDPDDAMRVMNDLNQLGIRLSIDDFGTGYSSLSYLKRLPVNEIKIDRSFVMEMANSNDDQVIVRTTLTMGHNLSLDVVAEGIEDASTLEKLKEMGCDLAQGYHIARPMPADDFFTWLADYEATLARSEDLKGIAKG